jgi:predicted outer membrane protein
MRMQPIRTAMAILTAAVLAGSVTTAQAALFHRHSRNMNDMNMSHSRDMNMSRSEMRMDGTVLSNMHHVNQMEISMGKLAVKRGDSPQVKNFGRQLQSDHQFNDKQVTDLAKRDGIHLASVKPSAKEDAMQHELKSARGPDFDRMFLRDMNRGHSDAVMMLTHARGRIHDPEVRRLVNHTIPAVQHHRHMARSMENKL